MQMQLTYCLPKSCDLEAIEGSGTLLNSNFLLKQILWFLGCLFHEKNSRYLKLLPQFELFSLYRDSLSYRESTVDLFRRIRSLLNS